MFTLTYFVAYGALAVFAVAVLVRIYTFARMPMHLRWELYPVPHEGKRAAHGGSYFEQLDWWTKPRTQAHFTELAHMAAEILFLVALRAHNRPMWRRSYPFHLGLYLVGAATALLFASAVLTLLAPTLLTGTLGSAWGLAIVVTGATGLVLGIIGALGLLERRITDPTLRDVSAPADYFNLVFFIVAFGWALATFVIADSDFGLVQAVIHNLVRLELTPLPVSGTAAVMVAGSFVLLGSLVAYIPLTHMSHFVGKYFAYHSIRWNDTPNVKGGNEEKEIGRLLGQKVGWAGPHIQSEGQKSWAQIATEDYRK